MHSKNTINETKTKIENAGRPATYLFIRRAGQWACHQSCHMQPLATSKNLSLPPEKQAVESFFTLS